MDGTVCVLIFNYHTKDIVASHHIGFRTMQQSHRWKRSSQSSHSQGASLMFGRRNKGGEVGTQCTTLMPAVLLHVRQMIGDTQDTQDSSEQMGHSYFTVKLLSYYVSISYHRHTKTEDISTYKANEMGNTMTRTEIISTEL